MKYSNLNNMINANLDSFGIATLVAQIKQDLDSSVNEDVFMYLIMTGAWSAGNRIFTFDKSHTVGMKLYHLIKEGYVDVKGLENLNHFIEVDDTFLNDTYEVKDSVVVDEEGNETQTQITITNAEHYQVIERGEQKFIKITDATTDLINLVAIVNQKAANIVTELPIIEENEI
jgi:hypothetical protein